MSRILHIKNEEGMEIQENVRKSINTVLDQFMIDNGLQNDPNLVSTQVLIGLIDVVCDFFATNEAINYCMRTGSKDIYSAPTPKTNMVRATMIAFAKMNLEERVSIAESMEEKGE